MDSDLSTRLATLTLWKNLSAELGILIVNSLNKDPISDGSAFESALQELFKNRLTIANTQKGVTEIQILDAKSALNCNSERKKSVSITSRAKTFLKGGDLLISCTMDGAQFKALIGTIHA